MQNLMVTILILVTANISWANEDKKEDALKSCLASIYTAQKAYYETTKEYSDNLDKVGFDSSQCKMAEFIVEHYADKFNAIAVDNKGKVIGSINSDKESTIY